MKRFFLENKVPIAFSNWLSELNQELENQKLENNDKKKLSCLIIHDRTDLEIPWEMLTFWNPHQKTHEVLGALIPVVRWQDIPDMEGHDRTAKLQIKSDYCCGDIFAFTIKPEELPCIQEEIEQIKKYFKVNHFTGAKDLLNNLEQVNSNISIVFIGSHGSFDEDEAPSFGEINKESENRLSLPALESWYLDFFRTCPSIVFMNCCHSGRLLDKKKNDPPYRQGFATFFLKRGAKGVIGTLEEVSDKYAAQISSKFFELHHQEPQLSVAAILSNLRKEAVDNLKRHRTTENELLFFYTFMYVYYGNSMTMLEITRLGE